MKRNKWTVSAGTMLFFLILTGYGAAEGDRQAAPEAENQGPGAESAMPEAPSGETDRDSAFALALENAGVPEGDAYNVKVEQDKDCLLYTSKTGGEAGYSYLQMFLGEIPGALGETSKLLLLVGFAYMCYCLLYTSRCV